MPGSSSNTQMVMDSSELPLTKWPALGDAVSVLMLNHWHGQCQNHIANGPVQQFTFWVSNSDGLSFKSTARN